MLISQNVWRWMTDGDGKKVPLFPIAHNVDHSADSQTDIGPPSPQP